MRVHCKPQHAEGFRQTSGAGEEGAGLWGATLRRFLRIEFPHTTRRSPESFLFFSYLSRERIHIVPPSHIGWCGRVGACCQKRAEGIESAVRCSPPQRGAAILQQIGVQGIRWTSGPCGFHKPIAPLSRAPPRRPLLLTRQQSKRLGAQACRQPWLPHGPPPQGRQRGYSLLAMQREDSHRRQGVPQM